MSSPEKSNPEKSVLREKATTASGWHSVARPNWDDQGASPTAKRHTVRQQPYPPQYPPNPAYPPAAPAYPPPSPIEQGFQQYGAPAPQYTATAPEPRKSIGSEMYKGGEKLVNGTGKVLNDTGQAIEGTAKNMSDGFRRMFDPASVTPTAAPLPPGTPQPNGFQAYSYNQPVSSPTAFNQGAGFPPPPAVNVQANTVAQPPATPSGWTAPPPTANINNPQFPPQSQQTPPPAEQNPQRYNSGASSPYVNLVDPRGNDPAGQNGMVDLRNQGPSANVHQTNTGPGFHQQPQNPSAFPSPPSNQQWPNHNPANHPNPNLTANNTHSNNNGNDPWGDWPPRPSNPNLQPPGNTQTVGYGGGNPNPGQDASKWGGSNIGPSNQGPNGPNNDNSGVIQAQQQKSTPWTPIVLIAAIGSIAWNFYLGMNYIDARNKYRAALRRSGRAYAEGLDDA